MSRNFKNMLLLFGCLLQTLLLLAQPGYTRPIIHLNRLTKAQVDQAIESPHQYRLEVLIDDSANSDQLKLLNEMTDLTLQVKSSRLPIGWANNTWKKLTHLTLLCNGQLQDLTPITNCRILTHVKLQSIGCKQLPAAFSQLDSLQQLSITSESLQDVQVLAQLPWLKQLNLNCPHLSLLPALLPNNQLQQFSIQTKNVYNTDVLQRMTRLQSLILAGIDLDRLPPNLPVSIQQLSLFKMPALKNVAIIQSLTSLQYLTIIQSGIEDFDIDLRQLSHLQFVQISANPLLKNIAAIGTIRGPITQLEISQLPQLTNWLFDCSELPATNIKLSELPALQRIDGVMTSRHLETLSLTNVGIQYFPVGNFTQHPLRDLSFDHCKALQFIDGVSNLTHLQRLLLYECPQLTTVPPSIATNDSLQTIHLGFLMALQEAPGLAGLKNLRQLYVRNVHPSFLLPAQISQSIHLQDISLDNPVNSIDMLHHLYELNRISLGHGTIAAIPDQFYTNTNISNIEIYQTAIKDLSGLVQCKQLKKLNLQYNAALTCIPPLNFLKGITGNIANNRSLAIHQPIELETVQSE